MPTFALRRLAAGAALLAATGVALDAPAPAALAASTPVTVTVNARAGLATVPDTGLGVNDAIWDSELSNATTTGLLGDAGVRMVRYPGGSYGDIYHWKDNTAPGGYVAPGTDFDTFMASVNKIGAQPMIIANYGTGTAAEAADWVRYANITKGYNTKYWAIGNEIYGNGHYGSDWEADSHTDKSPAAYAAEVVAYSEAMKAVDPSIKIGAVLTMPAKWPDGMVGTGDAATWNKTVLSLAGPHIDFADVHWYPNAGSTAEALSRTEYIEDAVFLLRQQIHQYGGADAARIGISLTETNTRIGRNTQPGALFLADAYSRLLANGVFTVQWWNVHNGLGTVSTVAGQTDYGDYGMLSNGTCNADGTVCEPAPNTPFPAYYGLKLLSQFARPGDQFVRAATDNSLVIAHATRRANGDLAVLLLNEDPDAEHAVTLDYHGYTPSSAAPSVLSYGNGDSAPTSADAGNATSQTLPPYSLTLVTMHQAASQAAGPQAPGSPVAGTITDRTATIWWPAVAGAAKYEVQRQNGAISEQFGETTGTSFTVGNLVPGQRYTVNVLARDSAGGLSWSSPPLTFTTTSPADAPCTVKLTDTSDWVTGFEGSVDITNNSANALTNWTLTFEWPTGWQTVSNGSNATWTQTGRTVRVTGPQDGTLAANGGSTTIGFNAAYSGPNVLPGVFTLNGTVCTTG